MTDQVTGCIDSSNVKVFISQGPLVATVTAIPDSICPGDSSQLNVTVTGGSGAYNYFWPALGVAIPNPVVYPAAQTTYTVNVSDGFSTLSPTVTVNIFPPLVITGQPTNSTIFAGSNAAFQVIATGAIGYQWQLSVNGGLIWNNTTNIPPYSGVTTDILLVTNAIVSMNNYQYKCIVFGRCDTLETNAAILKVDPVPIPIIATIMQIIVTGLTFSPSIILAIMAVINGADASMNSALAMVVWVIANIQLANAVPRQIPAKIAPTMGATQKSHN